MWTILPVVVMPEDQRGSVFVDEGVQLVREPDIFSGSRDVDVDEGELGIGAWISST